MKYGNEFKKAMIDEGIDTVAEMVKPSGLSKGKIDRILNSDGSSRIIDIVKLASFLGVELPWESFVD